ncbi:hypothetical protein ASZ90_005046 [hydrocarbon metagenome]|uniref:Secretion system C-terminal sorting domain-containing protein n=1 Tax=hydrocarbon metagenome TaxID=938273 RepID=A0A0W8FW52_9ZZZZ
MVDIVNVNDTLFYKIEESVSYFGEFSDPLVYLERYDSNDCYVYVREVAEDYYGEHYFNESPNYCLCTEIGDTVSLITDIPRVYFNDTLTFVHISDSSLTQFDHIADKKYFKTTDSFANFTLSNGFGLTKYHTFNENSRSDFDLVGCKINGVTYGDTSLIVSVKNEKRLPNEFSLSQNYPNPFNPTTKIKFTIPSVGDEYIRPLQTQLTVYDILGREIKTLLSKPMQPGEYEIEFDAASLPSGVYFYRLSSGSFIETKKMVLIR